MGTDTALNSFQVDRDARIQGALTDSDWGLVCKWKGITKTTFLAFVDTSNFLSGEQTNSLAFHIFYPGQC